MNNSKRGFAGKVSLFVGLMPFLLFAQSDYSYQPYPVLLVHGFNSTPKASWGIKTAKNENDERKISTAVALTDFEEPFSDEDAGNIARDLVNQFNNISGWKRPSSGLPSHRRFLPFEEEASYYDINHTFAGRESGIKHKELPTKFIIRESA